MFGIDSPELLVIAIVALVFIGPKELPSLLRTWGKWMAQMRGMASEFRGHVDEMVRQAELDDVKKHLETATGGVDLKSLDPTKQIRETIQEGMAEGEKAIAEAKTSLESPALESPVLENHSLENPSLENPMAEPESAPQVAAEPAPQLTVEASAEMPHEVAAGTPTETPAETPAEPSPVAPVASSGPKSVETPTKAAAE